MNRTNWIAVAVFIVLALVVLQVGVSLGSRGGTTGWGMMGPGMMGGWGFSPLGGFGMLFMWIIPIGFFALTVAGIVWLVRTLSGSGGGGGAAATCPSCGRGVQPGWKHCPHCGADL
ncbi:MAG: zinc ribbon domain-containing protein [Chloroflexi bacterium]|nr:zinc ribbon domain-containing protein [Chloroflexota bacterium]